MAEQALPSPPLVSNRLEWPAMVERRPWGERLVRRFYYKYFARNLLYSLQARASSLLTTSSSTPRHVHGFDSFEGLPENWAGIAEMRGKFSQGEHLPSVPPNVSLHKGRFEHVLPTFPAANAGPVAFAHIDCDLYSSTRTVLDALGQRLCEGSVLRVLQLSPLAAA